MKITLYTVNDCQFSKQEKDYLTSHQLQFEEKNLELNKEFLTEMLAISDNFAGTPVTKIEKDDGQSVVLKGFTQTEFDEALGYKTVIATEQKDTAVEPFPQAVVTPTPAVDLGTTSESQTASPTMPNGDINMQSPAVSAMPPANLPTVIEPPTQLTQDPNPPTPPTPEEPPTAPVVEAPKPPEDPKLASVLSNLQTMSTSSNAPAAETPTTPPPVGNMPSIPDPKFG